MCLTRSGAPSPVVACRVLEEAGVVRPASMLRVLSTCPLNSQRGNARIVGLVNVVRGQTLGEITASIVGAVDAGRNGPTGSFPAGVAFLDAMNAAVGVSEGQRLSRSLRADPRHLAISVLRPPRGWCILPVLAPICRPDVHRRWCSGAA